MTPCSARIRYAATKSSMRFITSYPPGIGQIRSRSIRLDARGRNDARPARQFLLHEIAEALGGSSAGSHALLDEQRADVGLLQQHIQFGVEFSNDSARRARGGEHAVPGVDLEVRKIQFLQRRHLGKRRRALPAHYREHAELPAMNVRRGG